MVTYSTLVGILGLGSDPASTPTPPPALLILASSDPDLAAQDSRPGPPPAGQSWHVHPQEDLPRDPWAIYLDLSLKTNLPIFFFFKIKKNPDQSTFRHDVCGLAH